MAADMKEIIKDNFLELAKEKDIDKITVKDLVNKAHIARQTFYYHFQDLLAVVEYVINEEVNKVVNEALKAESQEEIIYELVNSAFDNQWLFDKFLTSSQHRFYTRSFIKEIKRLLQKIYNANETEVPKMNPKEHDLMINFCSYGMSGMMSEAIRSKQYDKQSLSRMINTMLNKSMKT